ncbi:TPA: hypothetical protein ACRZ2U_003198 [Vibrio harveyi]
MRKIAKYIVVMVCFSAAVGCTEEQDGTLLVVKSEMLAQLKDIKDVCASTPDSEIRGSECMNQMQTLQDRIGLYLTPKTSQVIKPVLVELDDVSKSVYGRWVSFEKSNNSAK